MKKMLIWMLILVLLCGCSRHEAMNLPRSEAGYQLYQFFDCDKKALLEALEADGQAPQFEFEYTSGTEDGVKTQMYVNLHEDIYGLTWTLSLDFNRGNGDAVFSAYEERLEMEGWPDASAKEAIQSFIDDIVNHYGEPDEMNYLDDIRNIFVNEGSKQLQKEAGWGPFIRFMMTYSAPEDVITIWLVNRNSRFNWDHIDDLYPERVTLLRDSYEKKYRP